MRKCLRRKSLRRKSCYRNSRKSCWRGCRGNGRESWRKKLERSQIKASLSPLKLSPIPLNNFSHSHQPNSIQEVKGHSTKPLKTPVLTKLYPKDQKQPQLPTFQESNLLPPPKRKKRRNQKSRKLILIHCKLHIINVIGLKLWLQLG
jgi:hypothetical protein